MKKINRLKSSPAKWLLIYVIIISFLAFLFSSFKPKSVTDQSQLIDSTTIKKVIKSEVAKSKKNGKSAADTSEKIDSLVEKINPIQKYLDKYNAVDFSEYSFPFTIDYQENLKNKTVIFYILVQDIFEENRHYFIKAAKSFFGLNVYLKLECKKSMIDALKKTQFFTYAVVKINKIDNIYFNAKASSKNSKEENTNITLSSGDKNLLISGKCIATFEK